MKAFKLFACNIPVKGAKRNTICDLQRGEIFYISDGLYEILTELKNQTPDEIKAHYNNEVNEIIDGYFTFLVENELGFYTDEPERFEDLDLSFKTPEWIANAVIEIDDHSDHDWANIFSQLGLLGCKFIELRSYSVLSFETLQEIVTHLNGSLVRSIYVYTKYNSLFVKNDLDRFMIQFQRVASLTLHTAPENFVSDHKSERIRIVSQIIADNSCCGNIAPGYFSVNLPMFSESLQFNNCLNKKVAITTTGDIQNCPSLPTSFGNIKTTKLEQIIHKGNFQKLWHINKDQITVCKDCEFRYVCSDCRAFVDGENDKPVKCSYDPYTATWV